MISFWRVSFVSSGNKRQGFSLLELFITLLILAVITLLAIPALSEIMMRATLASQARELLAGVVMARSEAVKRNQVVILCASSNAISCTDDSWAKGWIVLAQNNQVVYQHKPLPDGFLINSPLMRVTFNASGLGASATHLTVCQGPDVVGSQERVVAISATGRPSLSITENADCTP